MNGYGNGLAANSSADSFESHRSRLFRVAYRLLGSRSEAEDVLQDAYLNWSRCSAEDIHSTTAFLVTITKRLCFDRLRELKHEREQCVGWWMPDPVLEDEFPSPEEQLELAEQVSIAFLAVIERLGPEERAAFLLHDVFDYDYPEVAELLGKAEPACRQTIHRARARIRDSRARFAVTAESQQRLLRKFVVALRAGDREAVMALLAEKVEYVTPTSTSFTIVSSRDPRRSGKQRSVDNVGRAPLFASVRCGDDRAPLEGRVQSPADRTSPVGYACPGRAQNLSGQRGGVYEMDNDTYETRKVG
jgi:RNA polymerase sigma factor (sigma-70 family)